MTKDEILSHKSMVGKMTTYFARNDMDSKNYYDFHTHRDKYYKIDQQWIDFGW